MNQQKFVNKALKSLVADSKRHDEKYSQVSKDIALAKVEMDKKAKRFDLIRNK